jgi:hypothetical protein
MPPTLLHYTSKLAEQVVFPAELAQPSHSHLTSLQRAAQALSSSSSDLRADSTGRASCLSSLLQQQQQIA